MIDLYDRYFKLIHSVFRALNNSAIAEDTTQETFLRVWNRIGAFDEGKGKLAGWLVTVARNRAFGYLRFLDHQTSFCCQHLGISDSRTLTLLY